MNGTLPLFQELEAPPAGQPRSNDASTATRADSAGAQAGAARQDKHLRAAWRLSRAMGRYPDRSAEQIRAGLAICQHLQALLAEARERGH